MRRHLVIFVKAPRAGAVKTRLGAHIGMVEAARIYRGMIDQLCRRLSRDPRWQLSLAVTPDGFRVAGIPCIPQGRGDLGLRMAGVFSGLPPGPAVIVGSDIPDLGPSQIWEAFLSLGRNDAVFGPSTDGGYWLIGLNRRRASPKLFDGVRWSSGHELADTLKNLKGRRFELLQPLNDIDTIEDWREWLRSKKSARSRSGAA